MKKQLIVISKQNNLITLANIDNGCKNCGIKNACGVSILTKFFQKTIIKNDNGEQIGDLVELKIDNKKMFINASILYLLPIFAMFIGALLAEFYYPKNLQIQLIISLFSFVFIIFFLFLLKKYSFILKEIFKQSKFLIKFKKIKNYWYQKKL